MERYSEYKDSGIYYIKTIPSSWNVLKAKYLFKQEKRAVRKEDDVVTCFRDGQVTLRKNRRIEGFTNSEKEIGYQGIRKGDLVIHNMDAFAGAIGISDSDGKSTPVYSVCTPLKDDINVYYYCYLMRSLSKDGFILSLAKGIRERSTDFRYADFKELLLPIPSLKEQNAIVNYIQAKTSQLDEAIAQQQRMIDLLNERKQIIIQHAVTKGLKPKAEMVESGVEWIGMMPKGWKAIPLRFVFEMRNGYTPSKGDPSFWTNGTIPWYRMEDIRKYGRILKEAHQYVTTKAVNGKGTFSAGSFIMAICTASIGEHAMLIADSLANQRFANFKICKSLSDKYLPMFLFYYFYVIGDFCRHNENSTCFQYVDMPALKRFPILMPSIEEQQKIVDFLDSNLANINKSLQHIEHRITLLRERKQIIINEVVTGKVKVS